MNIVTSRLRIGDFTMDMAQRIHLLSLDDDTRRFVPDEVFETVEEAAETIGFLMEGAASGEGPQVCPILRDETVIGYVQASPLEESGWEIGYHIGKAETRKGYATEAVRAFLPVILPRLHQTTMEGICVAENIASRKVLERCGFRLLYEGEGLYQGEKRTICRYRYTL